MLELKRNETETGIIYDDESLKPAILPWDWYWYDPARELNFSLDTVKAWKDYGNMNALSANKQAAKEYDADYLQKKSEKRSNVIETKMEYIDSLFKQE